MKLLILGGTKFLGRHLTEIALAQGHSVSLFHRGQTNPDLFPNAEHLTGDRRDNLEALQGRQWDAVIDTSGYVPGVVRASAELLADAVEHYTFISSISVYPHPMPQDADESTPVGTLEDETVEEVTGDTYGPLKALCEQAVETALPGRALNIRPGLIVGPYDPTDRFTYWVERVARGGEVLVPPDLDAPVQIIDVRDLARWILDMIEARKTGVYNATGPERPLRFGAVLNAIREATASHAELTRISPAFREEHEIEPWADLPLWLPAEMAGMLRVDVGKALADGLNFRPLDDTIQDTHTWAQSRPADYTLQAGLDPARETELLHAWHAANPPV